MAEERLVVATGPGPDSRPHALPQVDAEIDALGILLFERHGQSVGLIAAGGSGAALVGHDEEMAVAVVLAEQCVPCPADHERAVGDGVKGQTEA